MEKHEDSFQYTYSARQQEEIESIRRKYLPRREDKMEQLRRLDREAERRGTAAALGVGLMGTLILGLGMSCTMVWAGRLFIPGILIGIAGLIGVGAAFPLYRWITARQRKKLAPEILRLAEELECGRQNGNSGCAGGI